MDSLKRNQDFTNGNGVVKKRKSRWGEDSTADKNILNGIPTYIPPGLTREQEEQYILQLQVEEITRRLRTGELGIPENVADRSPSPEPMYSSDGKRLNTREYRVRKKLEENRHKLIQAIIKTNLEYKPPMDYRAPSIKINDRVYIPQDEHPEINFIGLLIGPRGNTLRTLEKETGTTVIIRGKGSVKDGKLAIKDGKPLPGQDEPLHAYITSTDADAIKNCIAKIKKIIQEGIAVPDADNALRQQQLKELALLNGTFREGDALAKLKQLQEAQTIVTNTIFCSLCGGAGHIAQDCKQKRPGESLHSMLKANNFPPVRNPAIDTEYMSLMQELGQEVPQNMRGRFGMGSVGGGGQFGSSFQRPLELPAPRYSSLPESLCPSNTSSINNNSHGSNQSNAPPHQSHLPPLTMSQSSNDRSGDHVGGFNKSIPSLMDIQTNVKRSPPSNQSNSFVRSQGSTGTNTSQGQRYNQGQLPPLYIQNPQDHSFNSDGQNQAYNQRLPGFPPQGQRPPGQFHSSGQGMALGFSQSHSGPGFPQGHGSSGYQGGNSATGGYLQGQPQGYPQRLAGGPQNQFDHSNKASGPHHPSSMGGPPQPPQLMGGTPPPWGHPQMPAASMYQQAPSSNYSLNNYPHSNYPPSNYQAGGGGGMPPPPPPLV